VLFFQKKSDTLLLTGLNCPCNLGPYALTNTHIRAAIVNALSHAVAVIGWRRRAKARRLTLFQDGLCNNTQKF